MTDDLTVDFIVHRQLLRARHPALETVAKLCTPVVRPAKLPRMTNPLGRHWNQPKNLRDLVQVYETHAVIPEAVFLSLSNYARSVPSGVYAGKAWRVEQKWLCWYGTPRMVMQRGQHVEVCTAACMRVLVV